MPPTSDQRLKDLERKRDSEGLTKEEANELGRMYAEIEGKPYSNADSGTDPDALDEQPEAWKKQPGDLDDRGDQELHEPESQFHEPSKETARPAGAAAGGLAPEEPEEGRDPRDIGP
jgi:hypothetical protein